jgi:hypothetical protein
VAHHRSGVFLFALLIASFGFVGCAGLVAGNGNPPPTTLAITNVLTASATTSPLTQRLITEPAPSTGPVRRSTQQWSLATR